VNKQPIIWSITGDFPSTQGGSVVTLSGENLENSTTCSFNVLFDSVQANVLFKNITHAIVQVPVGKGDPVITVTTCVGTVRPLPR
jgi:hypothetical protein